MKMFQAFSALGARLGPLEQRLMDALWSRGNATVREVQESNCCPELAYTTLMTTLDRLYKKGLLAREAEGRAFRYSPAMTREQMHRRSAGEAFRQMMAASETPAMPLSYLVEIVGEQDQKLLEELRDLVEKKRRELRQRELHNAPGKERE
jgi:BlaI family transcriptional regulator, penicillinase repressor